MKVSVGKAEESVTPTRVRIGKSTQAEVIAPFQYYSQASEAIYALEFASHDGIARLYQHIGADGRVIARVLLSDSQTFNLAALGTPQLELADGEPSNFADLMAEMHLAANASGDLYDLEEIGGLRAQSRHAPIVIGGCGRSGTTLLLSILGAHPNILAFPEELYAFYPFPFRLSYLLDALPQTTEKREWRRWCEKTPKNVRAFGEIWDAFDGEVRLVHVVRDGRAVVTSHHPNAPERYYVSPQRWIADVSAGLACGDRAHLIRYEDLVSAPEQTLRSLCEFIGEDFDERLLNFEQYSTVLENKAWPGHKARALHQTQVNSWQASEHLARVEAFMEEPGSAELMARLGYT